MMRSDVSVIVPTYNRAAYIARTIDAILAQTVRPCEVLVIDDGSSDDTESVCARYGARVRYVRQPNGGVSKARNHGASLATGHWLAFCDSDDIWRADKLAAQLAVLEATNGRWSITGAETIDLEDRRVDGRPGMAGIFPIFRDELTTPEELFSRYLVEGTATTADGPFTFFHGDAYVPLFLGNFALPSSAIVERDLFLASTGFDPSFRLAEETEFFHRLAAMAPVVIVMAPLLGYRVAQANSLVSSANIGRLIENALESNARAAALRSPLDDRGERHVRMGRSRLLRKLAIAEIAAGRRASARKAVMDARALNTLGGSRDYAVLVLSVLPDRLLALGLAIWRARR